MPERQPTLDSGLTATDSAEWKKLESETRPKWKYPKKDSFQKKKKEQRGYSVNQLLTELLEKELKENSNGKNN